MSWTNTPSVHRGVEALMFLDETLRRESAGSYLGCNTPSACCGPACAGRDRTLNLFYFLYFAPPFLYCHPVVERGPGLGNRIQTRFLSEFTLCYGYGSGFLVAKIKSDTCGQPSQE